MRFLTDEWATALFHDRFTDFCHEIKLEMLSKDKVGSNVREPTDLATDPWTG